MKAEFLRVVEYCAGPWYQGGPHIKYMDSVRDLSSPDGFRTLGLDLVLDYPVDFDCLVREALSGCHDRPDSRNHSPAFVVAVVRQTSERRLVEWTGMLRRLAEGYITDAQFAAHVRTYGELGDVSGHQPANMTPLAAFAWDAITARAYAGLASRLHGSDTVDNEAMDKAFLEKFDAQWEAMWDAHAHA